ncbi:MAG: hypothetical protein IKL86_05850 [Clostridia bacterium]|nr:hypothetical protein [Clostridia bacterium]
MTEKQIHFGKFEFAKEKGLEYLVNENIPETDFLLINEPNESFSLMFEKDFPVFTVPQNSDRPYCLFELKRHDRVIKFYCPERHKNLDSVVWYFYVEVFDENGVAHGLPGQVRVGMSESCIRKAKGKLKFVDILEQVKLKTAIS